MMYPTPHTVSWEAYNGTVRDPRGNVTDSWAAPVDVAVMAWYVPTSHEPKIAGHDRVVVDLSVLAPATWEPGSRDRVTIPGRGRFEVIGESEDYTHGPWPWPTTGGPGVVVDLRRVEG